MMPVWVEKVRPLEPIQPTIDLELPPGKKERENQVPVISGSVFQPTRRGLPPKERDEIAKGRFESGVDH